MVVNVMTIGDRIKNLRKALDLTQQEFADDLKVSRSNIATYEVGKNNPADAVIALICNKFNVSETWLRTGTEPMFVPKENDPLDELVKQRKLSVSDRLLIEKFMGLKPAERKVVMDYVLSVAAEYQKQRPSTQIYVAADTGSGDQTAHDPDITIPEKDDQIP